MSNKKQMSQEEIKHWVNRWKKLKPSKKRDMAIKIWSKGLKQKKDDGLSRSNTI